MIVVDQTVLAPFLFHTADFAAAARVSKHDSVWIVPPFWRLDFIDQAIINVNNGNFTLEDATLRLLAAEILIRESHEVIDNSALLYFAAAHQIPAARALYILTAQSLGAPLITSDPATLKCSPDIAVSLDSFGAT